MPELEGDALAPLELHRGTPGAGFRIEGGESLSVCPYLPFSDRRQNADENSGGFWRQIKLEEARSTCFVWGFRLRAPTPETRPQKEGLWSETRCIVPLVYPCQCVPSHRGSSSKPSFSEEDSFDVRTCER